MNLYTYAMDSMKLIYLKTKDKPFQIHDLYQRTMILLQEQNNNYVIRQIIVLNLDLKGMVACFFELF